MNFANLLLLGGLAVGLITLCVGLVNRVHSLPIIESRLKRIRHGLEFTMIAAPVLMFWWLGLRSDGLLRGGSWNALNSGEWLLIAIGGGGCLVLVMRTLRHWFYSRPSHIKQKASQIIDVEQELGRRPAGNGPYQLLARLPANEQFQIEVIDLQVQLPNFPPEWDGLRILHLSDWHFSGAVAKDFFLRAAELAREQPVDIVCFTGDLIDNPQLEHWIPETLGRLAAPLGCYFILGNHDWNHEPDIPRRRLSELGWIDVSSRVNVISIQNRRMAIGGDETPWMGTRPEFSMDADFRMLLSHTPDNIPFARRQQVDLMLAGHNHGGQVRLPIIGPVFSPSWYGCRYASGHFWESPTFLSVSRGLSGLHPYRFRCRPEITRLTLSACRPEDVG